MKGMSIFSTHQRYYVVRDSKGAYWLFEEKVLFDDYALAGHIYEWDERLSVNAICGRTGLDCSFVIGERGKLWCEIRRVTADDEALKIWMMNVLIDYLRAMNANVGVEKVFFSGGDEETRGFLTNYLGESERGILVEDVLGLHLRYSSDYVEVPVEHILKEWVGKLWKYSSLCGDPGRAD